ncbi:MAG: hypothetical protein HY868_20300 [Chloroflexi bacterium]|nr:hypothetical protein [Chloroflexota bacterium]
MDCPRVFLICVNRLVCEAVNLVLRREGFDLVGLETDPHTALMQVRALDPDVVLVEGNGDGADIKLMMGLTRLAYERKNLRIIHLSLIDNQLHIYHQEQRRMVTTQDLVAAIRAPV